MSTCPLCTATPETFLLRERVPVHQNLLYPTRDAARAAGVGRLELAACPRCGFVSNVAFDPGLLEYGGQYDNTQTLSPAFSDHLDALIRRLVEDEGVRDCRVVEVGCGKGDFLKRLAAWPGSGVQGFGFDPSYVGPDVCPQTGVRFFQQFYDDRAPDLDADVILCRHVIEHIPQPVDFLRTIRRTTIRRPTARLFFETPCVTWILECQVYWDFFYEHCSLFTRASLRTAFESAGFSVRDVSHVFGGQYLWLSASAAEHLGEPSYSPDSILSRGLALAGCERSWITAARARLAALSADGPIAIWGAGAKGATCCHLLDPNASLITCVVDINPNKAGRYLPATGHAIVSPAELERLGIRAVAVLNPNYLAEIRADLADNFPSIRAIGLMS